MCNQATSRCQACLFSVILPVLLASFYSGINLTRQVKEKLVHRMEFDCVTHHFLFQRDGNDEWGSDGEASPAASPSGQTWWNRGPCPGDQTSATSSPRTFHLISAPSTLTAPRASAWMRQTITRTSTALPGLLWGIRSCFCPKMYGIKQHTLLLLYLASIQWRWPPSFRLWRAAHPLALL